VSRRVQDTALWSEVQISFCVQVIALAVLLSGSGATCRRTLPPEVGAVLRTAENYAEGIEEEGLVGHVSGKSRGGEAEAEALKG
jgi:hypothetical protein